MLELASLRKAVAGLFIYCSKVRVFDMTFSPVLLWWWWGGGMWGERAFMASCMCVLVCACVYLMRNSGGGQVNNPGA